MKQVTTMICVVADKTSFDTLYLRQRHRWPMSIIGRRIYWPLFLEDDLPFWKMFRDLRRELPIFDRYCLVPKGLNEI